MTLFAQIDPGSFETATKLFGPMGAVCLGLCGALVYVFRLYHRSTEARIDDAKRYGEFIARTLRDVATIVRQVKRRGRARDDDSDPPPPSRARISGVGVDDDEEKDL